MKSSPNQILRGVVVDGVKFCTPGGDLEEAGAPKSQQQEHLKALEEFWLKKGQQEGHKLGFDEGWKEGEREGKRQGVTQGRASGLEEGKQKGLEEGLLKGKAEAEETLKEVITRARVIVENLEGHKREFMDHARSELIRFAIRVSEKVIRRELKEPEVLEELLVKLLDQAMPIAGGGPVQVFLSPEDHDLLNPHLEGLNRKDLEGLRFVRDALLVRGDCRVETEGGMVNFDVVRQLDDLEKKVLEVKE